MNSMEAIFPILVFLAAGSWEAEAMSLTGILHEKITIECSHSNAFSNVKYFCRGQCDYGDILISSREENKGGKYSITDEGNTFSVTIYQLTEEDSGTYWCGIERVGVDTYNKVVLTVIAGEGPGGLLKPNSAKLVYLGAGLGVVVLAVAMALLIFFRQRNRDTSASSGKSNNTEYATPSSLKHPIATSSLTANEDGHTDGRTDGVSSSSATQHQDTSRDHKYNFCSNVTTSPEAQKQPVGLVYSAVVFNKHTDCSTATPHPAEVTYSTVADISTDESSVYCNV
ncbi:uncharacterized protein [Trachinotus anak]|uniref:uncharacterized protein n=1 Tax=Trachinotus anak TaxID=443729 RepID=UPI0039F18794